MLDPNRLIIITGTSGSGKTTLINHLMSYPDFNLVFSVSASSRSRRPLEVDGQHYIFLSCEEFQNKISENAFLEWEEVYKDHFYGTLKDATINLLNTGKNILFDVDVKGALSIKDHFKEKALSIFIQPPSIEEAKERLIKRNTESLDQIDFRVDKIKHEIILGSKMDYKLVNNTLDTSKKIIHGLVNKFLNS
tara:strand:+ start:16099 stop:16674 length:576 start_codon:yes stop_codon:yes gene_type:complete